MRGKKANIIAQKRLKNAKRLMTEGLQNEFYDEVLRALWDYVGYKLNIPTEALSRDNIAENLRSNYVDNGTVNKFLLALDECEFKRYAPGDPSGYMNSTFEMAFIAISNIEQVMNKVTKR